MNYTINLCVAVKQLTLLFLFPLLFIPFLAEAQQKANPFIYNFEPEEYGAHNQTWEITQTRKGHIAIGTGNGIVIFDGESFEMVRGEPAMITDLITTPDGSTYYGANNILGQIVEDSEGFLHYHSLREDLEPEFREFGTLWNFVWHNNELFIPTRETLLRYSGEHFQYTTPAENTFFRAYNVGEAVYISEIDTGLHLLDHNGELNPVPGGDQLTGDITPYFILPYDDVRYLIGTVRNGLFLFYTDPHGDVPAGTLEPFQNEVNEQLAAGNTTKGIKLHNGHYAISTLTSGVFIINREGELVQKIDKISGLNSDVVHDVFEDRQGNLWIAMNFGFAIAEITSPVSFFDEQNGLEGSVIDAIEVNGQLYTATSMGLYQKMENEFLPTEGISTFTWDLKPFTDPQTGEQKLLAANDFGLYMIDGDEATQVSPNHTMSVLPSASVPERVYAGTPLGLFYVEFSDGEARQSKQFLEFENPVRQILEDDNGGIWIATQNDGLRYVLPDFEEENVRAYRDENSYNVLSNATLHQIEGELFVSTVDNFYQYDRVTDAFREWNSPGLDENELNGVYRFYQKGDTLWTGSSSQRENITEYRNIFSDSVEKVTTPFLPIPSTTTLFIREIFGDLWFGNARGLYQYKPLEETPDIEFQNLQIRQFDVISDTSTISVSPNANQTAEHPYSNARYRFTVAAPWYDADRFMEYRYRLEGYDTQWSDWTEINTVEYTSLREGNYTFTVQARNRQGAISNAADFTLVILPPWYRSIWAYIFYGFLLLIVLSGTARLFNFYQTRKLERFNKELEDQVRERSLEIRKQNEQLKQLNREKDEFMHIAVHDLRNPLSGIQGIAGLMTDSDMEISRDEVREFGSAIQKSTKRMFDLIDNYLNVHRIEQGLVKAKTEPVSLNQITENVIGRFESRAVKKDMHLDFCPENEMIRVMADPDLASQVLDNLLSNAIKYSPIGSTITVRVGKSGNRGFASIADQGPGISKDDQEKLYQKFSRIGTTPTGGEVSTGLGLSIVKQLMDMMNGQIQCESEPGNGAVFTIFLSLE